MGLSLKGLLEARKGTRIWILVKGSWCQEFYQSSVSEIMFAQWCCLGRDATCPRAQKRLWGSREEMSSVLGQASALLLYLPVPTAPVPHMPWYSKTVEINVVASAQGPKSIPTFPRETAVPWQTVPWGRWSFTANPPAAWFVFWSLNCWSQDRPSQGRAELWLSREQRRGLDVSQSSRWLFRRETKQQDEGEVPGMAECEWWGSGAGGRRCASPGAGLPGSGNSAPTVIYNPTVSVS